jgi:hypothetical protein
MVFNRTEAGNKHAFSKSKFSHTNNQLNILVNKKKSGVDGIAINAFEVVVFGILEAAGGGYLVCN